LSVIKDYCINNNKDLKNFICLDIGCSAGLVTNYISKNFKKTTGIDTDESAIRSAKKLSNKEKN
jgi:2-polyprenyl-3-methyl-5-hydroxy-6-metoxy-1,4-benzoquinol methylase